MTTNNIDKILRLTDTTAKKHIGAWLASRLCCMTTYLFADMLAKLYTVQEFPDNTSKAKFNYDDANDYYLLFIWRINVSRKKT